MKSQNRSLSKEKAIKPPILTNKKVVNTSIVSSSKGSDIVSSKSNKNLQQLRNLEKSNLKGNYEKDVYPTFSNADHTQLKKEPTSSNLQTYNEASYTNQNFSPISLFAKGNNAKLNISHNSLGDDMLTPKSNIFTNNHYEALEGNMSSIDKSELKNRSVSLNLNSYIKSTPTVENNTSQMSTNRRTGVESSDNSISLIYQQRLEDLYNMIKGLPNIIMNDQLIPTLGESSSTKSLIENRILELVSNEIDSNNQIYIKKLQSDLGDAREKICTKDEKINEYLKSLRSLSDSSSTKAKEVESLLKISHEKNQVLVSEINNLTQNLNSIQQSYNNDIRAISEDFIMKLRLSKSETKQLCEKVDVLSRERDHLHDQLQEIQTDYDKNFKEAERLSKLNSVYEIDNFDMKKLIEDLKIKLEEAYIFNNELTNQSRLLDVKSCKIFEENKNLKGLVEFYEKERDSIFKKYKQLEDYVNESQSEEKNKLSFKFERQIEEHKSDAESLSIKIEELTAERNCLSDELSYIKEKHNHDLSSLQVELAEHKSNYSKKIKELEISHRIELESQENKLLTEISNLKHRFQYELEDISRENHRLKINSAIESTNSFAGRNEEYGPDNTNTSKSYNFEIEKMREEYHNLIENREQELNHRFNLHIQKLEEDSNNKLASCDIENQKTVQLLESKILEMDSDKRGLVAANNKLKIMIEKLALQKSSEAKLEIGRLSERVKELELQTGQINEINNKLAVDNQNLYKELSRVGTKAKQFESDVNAVSHLRQELLEKEMEMDQLRSKFTIIQGKLPKILAELKIEKQKSSSLKNEFLKEISLTKNQCNANIEKILKASTSSLSKLSLSNLKEIQVNSNLKDNRLAKELKKFEHHLLEQFSVNEKLEKENKKLLEKSDFLTIENVKLSRALSNYEDNSVNQNQKLNDLQKRNEYLKQRVNEIGNANSVRLEFAGTNKEKPEFSKDLIKLKNLYEEKITMFKKQIYALESNLHNVMQGNTNNNIPENAHLISTASPQPEFSFSSRQNQKPSKLDQKSAKESLQKDEFYHQASGVSSRIEKEK